MPHNLKQPTNHENCDLPGNAAGVAAGLGTVENQSKINVLQWIDKLVSRYAPKALKVEDHLGQTIPGRYENILVGECSTIIAKLNGLTQWMVETSTAGLSLLASFGFEKKSP